MSDAKTLCGAIVVSMDGNGKLVQIREASELAGCSRDSLRRWERAGVIESRRGPNGYRLYKPSDLVKLLAGKVKRPRRVPLDRVHRCSFLKNALVDDCVQLVFLRPPTADARAGVHPDRFVGFIRPYLEEAKRILARKGSLILCAKETTRRGRDLYMVDLIRLRRRRDHAIDHLYDRNRFDRVSLRPILHRQKLAPHLLKARPLIIPASPVLDARRSCTILHADDARLRRSGHWPRSPICRLRTHDRTRMSCFLARENRHLAWHSCQSLPNAARTAVHIPEVIPESLPGPSPAKTRMV